MPPSLGSYMAGAEARCREQAGTKQNCLYIVPYSAFTFHVASLTAEYKSLQTWQYLPSSSGPKQRGTRSLPLAGSSWDTCSCRIHRETGPWEANTNWK